MSALGLHVGLLNDVVRTSAFDRALAETVRPGDVVADLGAGSGILALLALKHGARRAYAVERHATAELAKVIARENGVADRLTVVRGDAGEIRLPEKADVVVSETLGNAVFDEDLLEILRDARLRHLKPGGRMIPGPVSVLAAPATTPEIAGRWPYGLRMDALRALAHHAWWSPEKVALRGAPRVLGEATPGRDRLPLEFRGRWRTPGARGLLVWFEAKLSPSVRLDARRAKSWKPAFFPARERLRGAFEARLHFHSAEEATWQFDGQPAQTSALGELDVVVRAALKEDVVPRMSPSKARRAALLARVDGRRTLRELAKGLKGVGYDEALRRVRSACLEESLLW